MCGRFALAIPRRRISEHYELPAPPLPEVPDRYNIAPGQLVEALVFSRQEARRLPRLFTWGLRPFFVKDPASFRPQINARAETAAEKPSFRAALRYRRCLAPASGYYEWGPGPSGPKTPYYIVPTGLPVLSLAGLWETWRGPDGEVLDTLCLLTRPAEGPSARIHGRVPAIIPPAAFRAWLDPGETRSAVLTELLLDSPPPDLTARPVSTLVNAPSHDGPELIVPVGPDLPLSA